MKPVHELLRENFERWEIRGRGVLTFPDRVSPRPPFAAFPGHRLKEFQSGDDGVRHTAVSGLFARLGAMIRGQDDAQLALSKPANEEPPDEIEPDGCGEDNEVVELRLRLPQGMAVTREAMSPFLTSMELAEQPLVFEVIGTGVKCGLNGSWMLRMRRTCVGRCRRISRR